MSLHRLAPFPAAPQVETEQRRPETAVFLRRLLSLYPLQQHELRVVERLVDPIYAVGPRETILREGEPEREALVLLSGLACHQRALAGTRCQMTGFVLPGDFCDHGFLSSSSNRQSVVTLTPATVGRISLARLADAAEGTPNIIVAAMRAAAVDCASVREHVVSLGARDALQRLAHLLCEIHRRLAAVGLVGAEGQFDFPLTQAEIGEALGLSTVHVNRTLQQLRRQRLIAMQHGRVTMLGPAGLADLAGFAPAYLRPS